VLDEERISVCGRSSQARGPETAKLHTRAVFKGGGVTGSNPLEIVAKNFLICFLVSVFHISVQWSFNVDQFMQTFDS